MFNIVICDDENDLIIELKEFLYRYATETGKEFCFFPITMDRNYLRIINRILT